MNIAKNCPNCLSNSLEKSPAILMPFIAKTVFDWEPVLISPEDKFQTLESGKSYTNCNSVFCNNCYLLFLDIRFNNEEMNNLYKDYRGEKYINLREQFEPGYANRNKILETQIHYMDLIEGFISRNSNNDFKTLLDWGGGNGVNTPFLNKSSVKKYIYDIAEDQIPKEEVEYIADLKRKKFDLIVCLHVFEHLPFPLKSIQELLKNLKGNGYIYIEVPKESIIDDMLLNRNVLNNKKHWHEHVNFFSIKSLIELIKAAGLSLIDINSKNVTKDNFKLNIYQLIARKPLSLEK